jgi:hypothetical protein
MAIKQIIGSGLAILLVTAALEVSAEVTTRDLQVAARALGFMDPPLSGEKLMGIVFDPSNNRSRQQAENIRDMIGAGLASGNLRLLAELVPVAEIDTAQVDLFFLTEYLNELHINTPTRPCLTVALEQVRNGICAMGVQSLPRVDIIINRQAAEASGLNFAAVFRVMIREI